MRGLIAVTAELTTLTELIAIGDSSSRSARTALGACGRE